ncbi:MAG: hypothetical protein HY506_00635 [Candidatus Yanofskybacteria bacterium]|nr:hypothetical protein [Candidatus Yanofskybacteria bacterium]
MIKNSLKSGLAKIKINFSLFFGKIKSTKILGALSIFLAIALGLFMFADIDLGIKRGPLIVKLFGTAEQQRQRIADKQLIQLENAVLPQGGVILPAAWGDIGVRLVKEGVIDIKKFRKLYESRGGFGEYEKNILSETNNGNLKITKENSNFLLNVLWALGLGNQNIILDSGPMTDKKYGGDPSQFASTGGWTLAEGSPMNHYSGHHFLNLTPSQQESVARVSQNIYRPCCGNSTHFPDCNHGMAMLGLLELMASQGVTEEEMYKAALAVNAFWFPDTYLTIAKFLEGKGLSWDGVEPKTILGANFSSASGYRQILAQVTPLNRQSGGSCGI